jgi:rhodanese-related sulfurtransferase
MRKLLFLLSTLLIITNNAFSQQEDISSMSAKELKQELDSGKQIVVIDVRTAEELSGPLGKLDNIIHIPVQELENRISELEKYKENQIAVICRSGNRSRKATHLLIENGFNAKNVAGGMIEYRNTENSK